MRERQQALEEALQETSQFSDKLDGMLAALANTFEQVKSAEPVSAHPDKIQEQMQENQAVVEDLQKRESAFDAVKRTADEVIRKASNPSDPAIKDIKGKLERLSSLWDTVVSATGERGKSLEEALAVAERFWEELQAVMAALKELQETLACQEPPAVEPAKIQQQQAALHDIKNEIDQTKPEVEQCRRVGQELISLCGEPDKPEVKKHIEELDSAWDNITALYAKREENLIDAMEKAMEFHDTLNVKESTRILRRLFSHLHCTFTGSYGVFGEGRRQIPQSTTTWLRHRDGQGSDRTVEGLQVGSRSTDGEGGSFEQVIPSICY